MRPCHTAPALSSHNPFEKPRYNSSPSKLEIFAFAPDVINQNAAVHRDHQLLCCPILSELGFLYPDSVSLTPLDWCIGAREEASEAS